MSSSNTRCPSIRKQLINVHTTHSNHRCRHESLTAAMCLSVLPKYEACATTNPPGVALWPTGRWLHLSHSTSMNVHREQVSGRRWTTAFAARVEIDCRRLQCDEWFRLHSILHSLVMRSVDGCGGWPYGIFVLYRIAWTFQYTIVWIMHSHFRLMDVARASANTTIECICVERQPTDDKDDDGISFGRKSATPNTNQCGSSNTSGATFRS